MVTLTLWVNLFLGMLAFETLKKFEKDYKNMKKKEKEKERKGGKTQINIEGKKETR